MAGGFAVQLRAIAINITYLAVTRATIQIDATGTSAAAHTISLQLWQLGTIILYALSSLATIFIPQALNKKDAQGDPKAEAKKVANRMLWWGTASGAVLGVLQLLALPLLVLFSPLPEVQEAARVPAIIGAVLQISNGVGFVGELHGVLRAGCGLVQRMLPVTHLCLVCPLPPHSS